ncbi:hypothetical protein ACHAXR_007555 [Thalassiosira sp. AJA248-18]
MLRPTSSLLRLASYPTTTFSIRSLSKKSPNNNDGKNKTSFASSDTTPKFQDTEVPWYQFFQINNDADDTKNNEQQLQTPPMSKMLSILIPESKLLLLAIGALTISTAATMQFPNAIGEMIDLLSGSSISMVDAGTAGAGLDSIIPDYQSSSSSHIITDNSTAAETTPQQLEEQMQSIGFRMMSYFTIGAVATFVHSALFDSIGQKIGAHLRKELFTKLIHQDVSFFDQNRAGELANRLSTDVHEVAEHLVQNIAYFLSNFVRSITAVLSMIAISPVLTMYLSPLPILLGGCAAFYGKFIKHWSKQHLDVLAHSTHVATERFGGISTVLSFGQRRSEQARYSLVIEAAYGFARRVAVFQGAFLGNSYLIGNGALLGVLIVGANQVFEGSMTAGNLAGFCMYAGHLADSCVELSEATGGFMRAQGSGARLFSLLEREPSLRASGQCAATTAGEKGLPISATLPSSYNATIRFEGVEFAYPSHPNMAILNKVSLSINQGEMLAVTGSSGSGKSSVVSLLMRFYDPLAGRITLDGRDVRDLDVDWLRSQIGLVGQEPILFHGSVFENVAYGKPNATHDEVIEACIAANAHRFILELPDQYDTVVGERGASISGGQKQRLCIARALLTKPRVLALDEASSALDAPTEQDVLRRLRLLLETKENDLSTVLFLTHKRSVMQACDRVAVLSEGRIAETGAYDVLDRTKGDQLRKLMLGESSILK